ncbi:Anti-sigma-K factor rskA [Pustulibacterium marinum]|uniref:Anti-sigma-K factor rskA n=1 Tax=Pustulibacterium marinum TaxID=1224947 RepID=A0A1I7FSV1_9FLAO|nr:anti-sigma factor [Pustulibacterium marinum]SFU39299.1 Anti-sigma-K factor rskA [Pustulibacterium marinum]
MTKEELIESGKLELYVYGSLAPDEQQEVHEMILKHPEVKEEVDAIENALYRLSTYTSPYLSARNYERIKTALNIGGGRVVNMRTNKIITFIGYAAAVLLLVGIFSIYSKYNNLQESFQVVSSEKRAMETDMEKSKLENAVFEELREGNFTRVTLAGQTAAPTSVANVYWDKESNSVMIDGKGLPEPPEGKVYQVWSLTMDPLTPTSIGLLDNFDENDMKMFRVANVTTADAFGITLEPAGGSESPTMEQLYTLGKV